jgi:spore coat polysaccharide biosynthesis protein SpsF
MKEFDGAIFVIARLSSKRVPKKNLIEIDGIPMIARLCERLKKSKLTNKIIVCTSNEATDDPLVDYCKATDILVGRGSLENVMERICEVADLFSVENIIEVLGDNPFVQSELVDAAVRLFQIGNYDYVANYSNDYLAPLKLEKFPTGVRVQVYSRAAAADYSRKDISFLSHPTSFLYANPDRYFVKLFGAEGEFTGMSGGSDLNISVNYLQNLEFARYIFEKFGNDVCVSDVLEEIKIHPKLLDLLSQKNV